MSVLDRLKQVDVRQLAQRGNGEFSAPQVNAFEEWWESEMDKHNLPPEAKEFARMVWYAAVRSLGADAEDEKL